MTTMITEVYDALKEAGASEEKAKAAASALADYSNRFDRLELKIDRLESSLTSEIKTIRADMNTEFKDVRADIKILKAEFSVLKWMTGFVIAGIVSMIIRLFIA